MAHFSGSIDSVKAIEIAMVEQIIVKYGIVLGSDVIGGIFNMSAKTIENKWMAKDKDIPPYTQLKGKKVVLAQDLAHFILHNELYKSM